jgi:hypothetical protein
MTLEIQSLAWDRHKNVVGLNHLVGSQPTLLIIITGFPKAIKTETVLLLILVELLTITV